MILPCPLCHTRFLVPAQAFAHGARMVRCARCLHIWRAELPTHIDVVEKEMEPPTTQPSSPPSGALPSGAAHDASPASDNGQLPALYEGPTPSWVRHVLLAGLVGLLGYLILWFIVDRQDIVARWPTLESYYEDMGLHIQHLGEGLLVKDVRSELRYDGGAVALVIEGRIENQQAVPVLVPALKATPIGVDGSPIDSWVIEPPIPQLGEHKSVAFQTSIKAPKDTVSSVKLVFIEPSHEQSAE